MPSMRRLQELKVPGAEKVEAPEARPAVIKSFGSQMLLELPDSDSDDAPDGTRAPVTADRR